MADILPNKLQDLYNRLEARSKFPQTTQSLRQKIKAVQLLKSEEKVEHERRLVEALNQNLYNLKTDKWDVRLKGQGNVKGLCCSECTTFSQTSCGSEVMDDSTMNVLNIEKLESHPKGFFAKIFSHISQAASFKKFSYPYIFDSVLVDERIEDAISSSAREVLENEMSDVSPSLFAKILKKQKDRAKKILTRLRSTFNDFILRIASYTVTKVFGLLFSSVIVNPTQIKTLRQADSSNLPLLFLPLHRSHIDYIIITYALCNNNIKSPLIAAGENLNIPFFGWLLRGLGAFFIKRRVIPKKGEDGLYKAILQTYMVHSLKAGHNMEFFIEGGRTRSGKPCLPKSGLLSVIVDACMDNTIDDVLIVPVSVNYERLVEGNFIREQMGDPKVPETFCSAISAILKAMVSYYGMMRVDFSQPFSLKEMITRMKSRISPNTKLLHSVPSSTSLFGTDVIIDEHRQLVDTIARHVIYDCYSASSLMSTNIVSFLLLNMYRDGVTLDELIITVDKLRYEFLVTNKTIGFSGESVDVINHAVELLGSKLVKKEMRNNTLFIKPVIDLPNIIELSYYSNTVLPNFIWEALVAKSIYSLLNDDNTILSFNTILEKCQILCEILQFEFIFTKPCENFEMKLAQTIDKFVLMDILEPQQISLRYQEVECQRVAKYLEGMSESDVDGFYKFQEQNYLGNRKNKNFHFYNSLLQPFVDMYSICALNLQFLVSRQVPEKDYIKEIISDVKGRLNAGQFKYNECLSVDSIKNALKLLEKWNVLECHVQDNIKLYYLGEMYDDESTLDRIISQIEQYC